MNKVANNLLAVGKKRCAAVYTVDEFLTIKFRASRYADVFSNAINLLLNIRDKMLSAKWQAPGAAAFEIIYFQTAFATTSSNSALESE